MLGGRTKAHPMPPDFPEMFPRLGWEAIEDHYSVSQRTIRRWMRQVGEFDLITRRRAYLRKLNASRGIPSIQGRRPGVRFGGIPELPGGHRALAFMPIRRLRRRYEGEI